MAVCTVFLIAGLPYAMAQRPAEPLSRAELARMSAAAADASKAPAALQTTPAAAMALLKQPGRPWTMTVLGDSTGNGGDEWVYLLARQISDQYDRPVTIHDWSIDTNKYVGATAVGAGRNAPITIWNGSASGKGADYTLANLGTMAPATPDLVIISHGHNEQTTVAARNDVAQLVQQVIDLWKGRAAAALILQNPRLDEAADRQVAVIGELRTVAAANPKMLTIDVFKAFSAQPDLASLLNPSDRFHPDAAGEQLWAETVAAALGVSG